MTNNTNESNASCLCGAVKISAMNVSDQAGACHCDMCRKWAGGPFMAVDCGTDVSFDGEENLGTFASSDWAERGFCTKCGSNLFYKLKETGQYIMAVGIFDESKSFVFDHQVFIDEKPGYYSFANETRNMTGEECFAEFGS